MKEKEVSLEQDCKTIQEGWNPSDLSDVKDVNKVIKDNQITGISACGDYDSCPGD
jgi:hypothetical protein